MIHSWPGRHERHAGQYGERGNWVNLSAGSHKVEYFHFFMTGTWRESQLGWQLPGEGPRELPAGPVQHKLNARPLEPEDFEHSGATTLIKAQSTRGPLAIFQADWESYISPDKDPIYLCRFHPVGQETHPAATTYRWIFNAQQALTTPAPAWLFAGQGDQKVALIVSSGQSTSQCARVIFPKNQDPPQEISWLTVERGATRLAYSQVFLSMCQAVTNQEHSPCADWSTALWQGLLAVADSPLKLPLLTDIFERSRPDILKQPNSLRWPLEQLFYDALCQADPPAALQWLERFIKEERDPKRSEAWQAARIELWLYELDDLEQARKAAQQFMTAGASGGASILALIRMGDVEYFSGNLEEARRLYALAQESKDDPAPALPNIASARPAPSSSGRTPASSLRQPPAAASNVWKIAAVQEAAFYATVQSLLHQKALTEAQETLQRWEREHPLTKLAGDFPLAQARYYMAQQAYRRAEKILRNYRERVHLTNYLPEAMQLEFKCLALLGHNAEALELAQLIIERLPYHPLAEKAKIQLLPENRQHLTLGGEEEAEVTDWTAETHINSERLADLFKTKLRYIDFTQEEEDTLDDEMWEADYP